MRRSEITCVLDAGAEVGVATLPALEESDVRVLRQKAIEHLEGPLGGDRGADELGRHHWRSGIVEVDALRLTQLVEQS
jgi:hypothetical protein